MPVVLDASMTLSWCFKDEESEHSLSVLELVTDGGAVVPVLWHYEVMHTLIIGERRGRVDEARTSKFLEKINGLPIETTSNCFETCIGLARKHGLSVYDSAYLEMALAKSLKLESLDKALMKAYHEEIAA